MATLEKVMDMKKKGMNDQQIQQELQQRGVSPKEITDTMNQAQIKNAVSGPEQQAEQAPSPIPAQEEEYTPQPSQNQTGEFYSPQTQEIGTPQPNEMQGNYTPSTQEVSEHPMQTEAPQQEYYNEGAYQYPEQASTQTDSDTMIEIANQVFSEKIKKPEKQLSEINEFKSLAQIKLDNIEERLKRIEKMFDTLQIKVLEKVGAYGKEISSTKKEVSMLENTLEKIHKTKHKTSTKKSKK